MRLPSLTGLRAFEVAARHLNFRKASEELNVTQGAVAQQVRQLEADLGAILFTRLPRGLALTETGEKLFRPVSSAFSQINEATDTARVPVERVTVNTTPSFASKWLVARLGRIADRYPHIDLKVVASEHVTELSDREPSVSVRQSKPPFGDGYHVERLSKLDLLAVTSPQMANKLGPVKGVEELLEASLIQDGHLHWDRYLSQASGHRFVQFNQTALAVDAAAAGQGVCLAPKLLIKDDLLSGKLKVVWSPAEIDDSGFYLVWRKDSRSSSFAETVAKWIIAESREDYPAEG